MSTRSLTHVLDEDNQPLLTVYRQYDGDPEVHGRELFEAFGNTKLINGFNPNQSAPRFANGMGCLAAQIVVSLKTEIGGIYLQPPGSSDLGEDYVYFLKPLNGSLNLVVTTDDNTPLYDGPLKDFGAYLGPP